MVERIIRFESHIRHMIRKVDRDRILNRFDLWNYDDVVANVDMILDRINRAQHSPVHGEMPPTSFDGPWPNEWLALFKCWKEAGCPQLESPTAGLTCTVTRISPSILSLKVERTNPEVGFAVWLETVFESDDPLTFSLFREPPISLPLSGTSVLA